MAKKTKAKPGNSIPAAEGGGPVLMMASLFQGFLWFDRQLQQHLQNRGWPAISRTESQIMLLISTGVTEQKAIARMLDLSPQAVNQAFAQLTRKGLIALTPDPADRRRRIITLPPDGEDMRLDAMAILAALEENLAGQLGSKKVKALHKSFRAMGPSNVDGNEPAVGGRDIDRWRKRLS